VNKDLKTYFLILIAGIALVAVAALIYQFRTHKESAKDGPQLKKKPERIVSLAPNITDILLALELQKQIVAVSSDTENSPLVKNIKKVGSFWKPNLETIIASKPDLIITLDFEQQKQIAKSLTRLGYPVLCLKLEKIDHLFSAIEKIGKVTKQQKNASEMISNLQTKLDALESRFASEEKVKVLWVVQQEPLRVAGTYTFINEVIKLAGGNNVIGPTIQQYPSISTEQIWASKPEVIIQSAMGNLDIKKQQESAEKFWSKWENIPAVKNNRIFVIDANEVLRLGPELPRGVRIINKNLRIKNTNENQNRKRRRR